jgi:L-lactate dehydrogenase complex protein LldG
MEETTTREKIYKSIRNALIEKTDNPFPDIDFESSVFVELKESEDLSFAQEFTRIGGKFAYCEDADDMAEKLKFIIHENKNKNIFCFDQNLRPLLEEHEIAFNDEPKELLNASIGITYCECLVARLGSVVVSSRQLSGRRLNVFPEVHVVVAKTNQLVKDLKSAFDLLKNKYTSGLPSAITVISGPSRTADIEKTLVMGAHGPKELYVLLVEED